MFFSRFWPSFSFLNYFWSLLSDTRSIQNFRLKAWKYKWLTAKNSKSKAIIWCKWKINKDKSLCNFYLNCAKGNNSKKCFQTFFSQSATHKNSLCKKLFSIWSWNFLFSFTLRLQIWKQKFSMLSKGYIILYWLLKRKKCLKKDNFST